MKLFVVCFLLLFQPVYAQPKQDPLLNVTVFCQRIDNSFVPFSKEYLAELIKNRAFLTDYLNSPPDEHSKIKATGFLYQIQFSISLHTNTLNLYDTIEVNKSISVLKDFRSLEVKKKDLTLKDRQQMAISEMNSFVFRIWEGYKAADSTQRFLSNPEFRQWYDASNGNGKVYQLFEDVQTLKTLDEKIQMLESAETNLQTFCNSPFSDYPCESIDQLITELKRQRSVAEEQELAALKRKEEQQKLYDQKVLETKEQLLKADDLNREGDLEAAVLEYSAAATFQFEGNYGQDSAKAVNQRFWAGYIYDNYLFDKKGKLRIDSTFVLTGKELKLLKEKREKISVQLIKGLHEYENRMYRDELPKVNYDLSGLQICQITDTLSYLYKVKCDSSAILSVEYTLLSGDEREGAIFDSIIRTAIPGLFPLLKIDDGNIHEYLLPIIYIPLRHRWRRKSVAIFCNCQLQENNYGWADSMGSSCFKAFGSNPPAIFSLHALDEFYFVVTDGAPLSVD